MQKLEPIKYDKNLSAFRLSNKIDEFDTTLVLDDYDWMHYTLSSRMPTKAYGDIRIEFEYLGFQACTMRVETKKKTHYFQFDHDLFKEHIIKFLQRHIQNWDEKHAFFGIEEVVNFYNAVLASPRTVEDGDRDEWGPLEPAKNAWKTREYAEELKRRAAKKAEERQAKYRGRTISRLGGGNQQNADVS